MKATEVKVNNVDLYGQEITAGDWIVLASSSSHENPFRFGYVSRLNKDGKPLYYSFEFDDRAKVWFPSSTRIVAASVAHKTWKIPAEHLPEGLKLYIQTDLGGDPSKAYLTK